MNWPSIDDFREARRGLAALAAAVFTLSVLFPMWHIHISAVQYPDTVLHLKLYAYPRLAGDYGEVAALNKYVGYYYPDPVYWQPNYEPHPYAVKVPEWSFGPLAFVGVSALTAFVAVAPTTEKLKRGLKWQLLGTVLVFGTLLADIQYRLWQTGHHLDPDAPVMGVDGFTPPIWGVYEVANITSYSHFGGGAFMAVGAVGLLVVAFYYRDSTATVGELPGRFAGRIRWLPDAVRDRGEKPPGEEPPGEAPERSRAADAPDRTRAGDAPGSTTVTETEHTNR